MHDCGKRCYLPLFQLIVLVAGVAALQANGLHSWQRIAPFTAQIPTLAGHVHLRYGFMVLMVMGVTAAMAAAVNMLQPMQMAIRMRVPWQPVLRLLAGVGRAQIAIAPHP